MYLYRSHTANRHLNTVPSYFWSLPATVVGRVGIRLDAKGASVAVAAPCIPEDRGGVKVEYLTAARAEHGVAGGTRQSTYCSVSLVSNLCMYQYEEGNVALILYRPLNAACISCSSETKLAVSAATPLCREQLGTPSRDQCRRIHTVRNATDNCLDIALG